MVKNLPAVWETRVRSLGWEDALEEGMVTHSSILAWRIPWTEEPSGLQSFHGVNKELDIPEQLTLSLSSRTGRCPGRALLASGLEEAVPLQV